MMASPSSELTLDCKPHMNTYSMLLKSFGEHSNFNITHDQTQKLEDFLSRLEEERLKIDAFKRELPLCMQLLSNAMETSRQQLQTYRENQARTRPVLEEFIPLKQSCSDGSEKTPNMSDKANWMTSAELWCQTNDGIEQQSSTLIPSPKESTDIGSVVRPKLGLDVKQRNSGAFLPFSKERNSCPSMLRALPELALSSAADKEIEDKKLCTENDNVMSCTRRENPSKDGGLGMGIEQGKGPTVQADSQTTTTTNGSQTHRKVRRCWSPDLHRRFVNALQVLGGSQVATPKQIRDLMKVDGLTNDEVKSHLQKYRLHTRRPSPSPQAAGTPVPQLVVLGGIWVPPEYATAAAAAAHHGGAPTLYSAHPSTHHAASPHYPIPQEYYSAALPPQAQAAHQLHHQLHMYKPSSPQTHSSPESDIRGNTGDRSESIEGGKSESSSWKADSGSKNGGERKGLVIREDGEESNGSDVTLKF